MRGRKLAENLSLAEQDAIKSKLKGNFTCSEHALDKLEGAEITANQLAECITDGKLIEVHNLIKDDVRVVLRKDMDKKSLCMAVSLIFKEIITCWFNEQTDNHRTLNVSNYTLTLDIRELL